MTQLTIQIKGLDKLKAQMKASPAIVKKHLNEAINRSIDKLEGETKKVTPVDTGRLRASIGGGTFKGGSFKEGYGVKMKDLWASIGTNVKYAPHVHKRKPFFKWGVQSSERTIDSLFKKAGDNIVKELAK